MLWLSRYYSYRLVYYRPSTSYRVEPTYEGSVKLRATFLKEPASPSSFGARFRDNSQKSTFTCIKTSGSESRGLQEAACMRVLGLCDHYSELFSTDGSSNFLKCCGLAASIRVNNSL